MDPNNFPVTTDKDIEPTKTSRIGGLCGLIGLGALTVASLGCTIASGVCAGINFVNGNTTLGICMTGLAAIMAEVTVMCGLMFEQEL